MKRTIMIVAMAAASCSNSEEPTPPAAPTEYALSATASAPSRWVAVRSAQDASLLSAPCIVRAASQGSGEVSTTFRAQIKKVLVQVGDTVSEGQSIALVVAPEVVSAAAEYIGISSRLKVHRERLVALQALRKEGMVRTAAVFEQKALIAELSAGLKTATAVLKMAQLQPRDAAKTLKTNNIVLVAPVAGVVSEIHGHPGEVLDPARPVVRIVGAANARIEATSPVSLTAGETVSMVSADGTFHQLVAKPISTIVSADSGMHKTWFSLLDSSVRLSDGQRCTLEWTLSSNVWEAPLTAIATREKGTVVWRTRDGKVSQIPVQVVKSSGSSVLILGDMQEGDLVAADGSATQAALGGMR